MRKLALICSLILSLFLGQKAFSAPEKIKVRADFWCPYNCKPNSDYPGYMVELLYNAFGKQNVDYDELNWARSLKEAREGKIDGIIGVSKDDARDFVYSKQAAGKAENCYYTKKTHSWKYTTVESLKSETLGIIQDYSYYSSLNDYIARHKNQSERIQSHPGNDALIRMLQKLQLNRLSVVIEDPNVMNYALKYYPKFADVKEAGCVNVGELYIAFSPTRPRSKQYAQKLDDTITKMHKDGSLQKLVNKYHAKFWLD